MLEIQSIEHEFSYLQAHSLQKESAWRALAGKTLGDACEMWLGSLNTLTQKNYRSGMSQLSLRGILNMSMSLQAFTMVNSYDILEKIRSVSSWSACTKQARAACYIAFTAFLARKTNGMIQKCTAIREGTSRTFFRVRDKVKAELLTKEEWTALIAEMKSRNVRDGLIAAVTVQGARRINEVLQITLDDYDHKNATVSIRLSKTRGCERHIEVTLPQSLNKELQSLVGTRKSGFLFETSGGKAIDQKQFSEAMKKAAKRVGITKRVHAHALRASAITCLRKMGLSDVKIMKLSGHASSQMLGCYDKSEISDNASKEASLV